MTKRWSASMLLLFALGCGQSYMPGQPGAAPGPTPSLLDDMNMPGVPTPTPDMTTADMPDPVLPPVAMDTPSNELSEDDREAVCVALSQQLALNGVRAAECKLLGYGLAQASMETDLDTLRTTCADAAAACMDGQLQITAGGNFCEGEDCTGTVAEGIACTLDAGQGTVMLAASLPECEQLTEADIARLDTLELPPSAPCAQFNATCSTD